MLVYLDFLFAMRQSMKIKKMGALVQVENGDKPFWK